MHILAVQTITQELPQTSMVSVKGGFFGRLILILFGLSLVTGSSPLKELPPPEEVPIMVVRSPAVEYTDKDLRCLALNIYHEARSEPISSQIAVAYTTINRANSTRFGPGICKVVYAKNVNGCQFSWVCSNVKVKELAAWRRSELLAEIVLGTYNVKRDPTKGALWYHAMSVYPYWAKKMEVGYKFGDHVFYPGDI